MLGEKLGDLLVKAKEMAEELADTEVSDPSGYGCDIYHCLTEAIKVYDELIDRLHAQRITIAYYRGEDDALEYPSTSGDYLRWEDVREELQKLKKDRD